MPRAQSDDSDKDLMELHNQLLKQVILPCEQWQQSAINTGWLLAAAWAPALDGPHLNEDGDEATSLGPCKLLR